MTSTTEALKMAIEAMQSAYSSHGKILPSYPAQDAWMFHGCDAKLYKSIEACKEALAEAEKQEWQSLNADEIDDLWDESSKDVSGSIRLGYTTKQHYFYVLIEQALKEKNKC
jgi:hypothetical protein